MSEQWVNVPQPAVCYELSRSQDHGYYHFDLYVFSADCESLDSLLAGAMENKAGYDNPETAAKLARNYQRLIDSGYSHLYSLGWRDRPYFRIRWQEYDPSYPGSDPRHRGYCQHKFEVLGNGTIESIKASLELVERLLKFVGKDPKIARSREDVQLDDPKNVIAGLIRMGAVRVEKDTRSTEGPVIYLEAKGRRQRLRSEGILSMFGA